MQCARSPYFEKDTDTKHRKKAHEALTCQSFKNKRHLDLLFPLCRDVDSFDNQQHLLKCTSLMDSTIILLDGPVYEDLFSDDLMKQIAVANVLVTKFTKRKELLKTT